MADVADDRATRRRGEDVSSTTNNDWNDGEDPEVSRANQARHIADGEDELLRIQRELDEEIAAEKAAKEGED